MDPYKENINIYIKYIKYIKIYKKRFRKLGLEYLEVEIRSLKELS